MKSIYKIIPFCFLLATTGIACKKNASHKQTQERTFPKPIVLPEIPPTLVSEQDRIYYLLQHYWDSMDFTDTTYVHHPDITEQSLVDYIDLLNRTENPERVKKVMDQFFVQAAMDSSGVLFHYIIEVLTRYLRDPNSPLRNETNYAFVVENILNGNYPQLTQEDKEKARFDLSLIEKNKRGTIATDFDYTLLSGGKSSLHRLKVPYTLLFFYEPDCSGCKEYVEWLRQEDSFNSLVNQGTLKVLTLYVEDDLESWRKNAINLPSSWIKAYDEKGVILQNDLYHLEASPTLYLLDTQKKVILKDAALNELFHWINQRENSSSRISSFD